MLACVFQLLSYSPILHARFERPFALDFLKRQEVKLLTLSDHQVGIDFAEKLLNAHWYMMRDAHSLIIQTFEDDTHLYVINTEFDPVVLECIWDGDPVLHTRIHLLLSLYHWFYLNFKVVPKMHMECTEERLWNLIEVMYEEN